MTVPRRPTEKPETGYPLLGAHMSVASGLHRALDRLREVGGQSLQIFLKNQRQWTSPPLSPSAIARFLASCEVQNFPPIAAHAGYLINLASSSEDLIAKSIESFTDEITRAKLLRIPYLVIHPGAHLGTGVEAGLHRFIRHMDTAIERAEAPEVRVLIENTAGQGTQLGSRFEEIGVILGLSRFREQLGMCFDTAHAFAAGYDIRRPAAYHRTFDALDRLVKLNRVRLFHLNDSRRDLGSRVDRHEHIGRGKIGFEGFRLLLNDKRFAGLPMVLETPKEDDLEEDRENLRVLRGLLA